MKPILFTSYLLFAACVATSQEAESEDGEALAPTRTTAHRSASALLPTAIAIQTDLPPQMVLVREGVNGIWRPAQRLKATTYEAMVSGPYTVLVVCPVETGPFISASSQTLQDELLVQTYCTYEDYPFVVSGTMVQAGAVAIGDGQVTSRFPGWSFDVSVQPGSRDLIASSADRLLVQRDLQITGDLTLPTPLDLAQQGIPLISVPVTVTNSFPGEEFETVTFLRTPGSRQGQVHRGGLSAKIAPTAALGPRDRQELSVRSRMFGEVFLVRTVRRAVRTGDRPAITFWDPFANLDTGLDANGDLRLTWSNAQTRGYRSFYAYDAQGHSMEHYATASYLTATDQRQLTLETDVPGMLPEWRIDLSRHDRGVVAIDQQVATRYGFQRDEYDVTNASGPGKGLGDAPAAAAGRMRLQQARELANQRRRLGTE